MNHILCPPCRGIVRGEEKCCTHGCALGIKCVRCGAVRGATDPYWTCAGGLELAPVDRFERTSLIAWLRFQVDCEEHDRTLPCVVRHGEWIPVHNGKVDGRAISLRFARHRAASARGELHQQNVPLELSEPARRYAQSRSYEQAKCELEYLMEEQ